MPSGPQLGSDFSKLHEIGWLRSCQPRYDARQLMGEISKRTDLPIALEGIYRWIVFLPSRLDKRVPVPNRYFGVFSDGTLKTRGIECNRHDTPPFIARTQLQVLQKMASLPEDRPLRMALPELIPIWRSSVSASLKRLSRSAESA